MKQTFLALLLLLLCNNLIARQTAVNNDHPVTFKLKITEFAKPDTIAIVWFTLPYKQGTEQISIFPNTLNNEGLYQQTISFNDSIVGKTVGYLYAINEDNYDIMRNFVLQKDQTSDRIESWGYVDGLQGKVKATKMLFTEPDSPEEKMEFAKPFVGITTNGTAIENLFPIKKTGSSTLPIKNAVAAFLETLSKEEKEKFIFPIESNEWRRWHNIERWKRAGICLEDMTGPQKKLVFAFLKESLSARGLQKAKEIMTMEGYLATLVPGNQFLGWEKYWFTFFGTPSDTQPWGWQMEGHHLVINYFIMGDQVVMTPTFMGSEPTLIDSGENKGLRTFEKEEKKGLDFYKSLDSLQKKEARLWNKKDGDLNRSEAFRDNEIIATTGIAASKLSAAQKDALLDLIAEYVNNMRDDQAKIKMDDVKLHLNETHFTWVQSDDLESPFYYRIHSPVVMIEFDHQTPVFLYDKSKPKPGPVKSHIHTVVRTPNGNDYGRDLLKEHLEKDHKRE
ncbi:MAG: DUF3500 domain-containing protein [Ginsengibacter sp.]